MSGGSYIPVVLVFYVHFAVVIFVLLATSSSVNNCNPRPCPVHLPRLAKPGVSSLLNGCPEPFLCLPLARAFSVSLKETVEGEVPGSEGKMSNTSDSSYQKMNSLGCGAPREVSQT